MLTPTTVVIEINTPQIALPIRLMTVTLFLHAANPLPKVKYPADPPQYFKRSAMSGVQQAREPECKFEGLNVPCTNPHTSGLGELDTNWTWETAPERLTKWSRDLAVHSKTKNPAFTRKQRYISFRVLGGVVVSITFVALTQSTYLTHPSSCSESALSPAHRAPTLVAHRKLASDIRYSHT